MTPLEQAARDVVRHFGLDLSVWRLHQLGNAGGFSGSRLWRLEHQDGRETLCLRAWPEGFSGERLRFIHAVIDHAAARLSFVPQVRRTAAGHTVVEREGRLWELTTWLPGEADESEIPSAVRVEAALTALATFHRGVEDFEAPSTVAPSPGIAERIERLKTLERAVPELVQRLPGVAWPELAALGGKLLPAFVAAAPRVGAQLEQARALAAPLQVCLRDVTREHVLFVDEQVTGIIDFGAVRVESVAADIARLLGSIVGDDAQGWECGLRAFEKVRPLSPAERQLVSAFDASTVAMAGMNWLVWLVLEGRQFDDRARAIERVRRALERLETQNRHAAASRLLLP